jgi:hypothetical protein
MGGVIISESGGGIIPLRGATSSRNWGAASSGISRQLLNLVFWPEVRNDDVKRTSATALASMATIPERGPICARRGTRCIPAAIWAHRDPKMKDARPAERIIEDIAQHLAKHPPLGFINEILRRFLEEMRARVISAGAQMSGSRIDQES